MQSIGNFLGLIFLAIFVHEQHRALRIGMAHQQKLKLFLLQVENVAQQQKLIENVAHQQKLFQVENVAHQQKLLVKVTQIVENAVNARGHKHKRFLHRQDLRFRKNRKLMNATISSLIQAIEDNREGLIRCIAFPNIPSI
jgi:hypothetical protein